MTDQWIKGLNKKLDRCSISVRAGKDAVYLVATLPSKTDPNKQQQQRVPTGCKASKPEDRKRVKELAFKLDEDLVCETFSWSDWTKDRLKEGPTKDREVITFSELAQAIEDRFDANYPGAPKTGRGVYTSKVKPAINRIKLLGGTADMSSICGVVASIESPSSRKTTGSIISGAIDHLKLGWDKKALFEAGSGYKKADLTEKDIPSDKEILEIWESISDPRWKWVHGMVAAFGIRPSESRETSFKGNRIDLMTYKTKGNPYPREAWALPEDWVKELSLKKICLPPCSRLDIAAQYGDYMERNNLKYWPLYNLRHAYAIRCLVNGVETGLASRLMGHSVEMHRQHYQRWINQNHMDALYEKQHEKFRRG